ncbi:MAG: hypothetical protein GWN97_03675, partial [Thermoplasmata archaeon]|nr:hypothetical protein [Thermoplasmata archaeon]
RTSYLIGADPEGWVTDIKNYRELMYHDLWDGIDLRVHLSGGDLKYEFVVEPGSDPSVIAMHHEGAEAVRLGIEGNLL